ncbi:sugar transporter [Synechococcus sp. KORDI-52]|uniref:capsular polysaccharide biosynthesis protein n=1 Tax=Synechococcus sp. KORDI-52 TaxID=585425 RepID=UPI0004E03367|nr:capsular polysaccharide biosynthesis protein [Synechococcus sp. KORDI-52]AII48503.1 sugar transporter [Synechococcus sp. KORDI-52]
MTRPAALRLGVPARGMLAHRTLAQLLAPDRLVPGRRRDVNVLLAWGRRPSALRVERLARQWDLPVWHLEDGLLRSVAKGRNHPPLGLLVDELGVHFDATVPSRMEQLIATPITMAEANRARALQRLWCEQRLSKVNPPAEAVAPPEPFVLVVDQSAGDRSIALGLADGSCFQRMLQAALVEHPECTVVLKVHPDVIAGRARGHFNDSDLRHPRVRLSADAGHPAGLLERARAVYVVTSQMGFEALLWGRPVHCFGMPFYAGWGLTHDHCQAPVRRCRGASLEALVHAALVGACRCIDPHRHQPCSIETLMRAIGLQRRLQGQQPRRCVAFGFTPWKQRSLRRFLAGSQLRFRAPWRRIPLGVDAVVVWGRRARPRLLEAAARRKLPVLQVEDGFLRSVGLGADLVDPVSWVVDHQGVYYDATRPSDLETCLATGQWTQAQRQRAAALRQRLVKEAITKYNLQAEPWVRPAGQRRVVLVIGQVESDASIRYGAPGLRSNRALLSKVRSVEPEAYLLYKPHPDVVAGLCRAGAGEDDAAALCDEVLPQGSIQQLFTQIDAVHVLTSLAGFEALLRGLEVHCWGLPFYAGWGLTQDRERCCRRQRQLSLDELVHASLIDYPRYVSRDSGWFITPEQAIDELVAWRAAPPQRRTLVQALFRHWGRLRRR